MSADTICDRCSTELPLDEACVGEPGTEFEGCTLCAICNGENNDDGARAQ